MRTTDPRLERFRQAYLQMAQQAKYRPQAPSDGFCNILLEPAELCDPDRLWREATEYALQFSAEEDGHSFWIGCSDFRTNRAFAWSIEAARLLAAGDFSRDTALKLLRMAVREVAWVSARFEKRSK
jgi:hypothetical protein